MNDAFSRRLPLGFLACLCAFWTVRVTGADGYFDFVNVAPASPTVFYNIQAEFPGHPYTWNNNFSSSGGPGSRASGNANGFFLQGVNGSTMILRGRVNGTSEWIWFGTFSWPCGAGDCSIEVGGDPTPPPCDDRFKREWVVNEFGAPIWAQWYKNGVLMTDYYLDPGESASYMFTWDSCDEPVLLEVKWNFYQITELDDLEQVTEVYTPDPEGEETEEDADNNANTTNVGGKGPLDRTIDVGVSSAGPSGPPVDWDETATGDDVTREAASATIIAQREGDARQLAELIKIRKQLEAGNSYTNASEMIKSDAFGELPGWASTILADQETQAGEDGDALAETLDGLADEMDFGSTPTGSKSIPLEIAFGSGSHSFTMDLDPESQSIFGTVVGPIRAVLGWLATLWLFVMNLRCFESNMRSLVQVPQNTSTGQSVAGVNLKLPSTIVVTFAILAVLTTLPVLFMNLTDTAAFSGVNPLSLMNNSLWNTAIYYADKWVPLAIILSAIANHLFVRVTLFVAFLFGAASIRSLFGI